MVDTSQSMRDYVENFRANLPAGITYDPILSRYFCNDRRFLNEWEVERYLNYIKKFGFTAISAYAVAGLEPELVFDFENEVYRTNGSTSTFDDAMTFSRSGNATMVDSDGLLKWAPHNLVTYSEDFSNWVVVNGTVTTDSRADPDGLITADDFEATGSSRLRKGVTLVVGAEYTLSFWAYLVSGTVSFVRVATTGTLSSAYNSDLIEGQWVKIERTFVAENASEIIDIARDQTIGAVVSYWGAHLYRSDLGGMVDNPDRGDSYVPTTSAARYLPRRGHHVYNGAEWVNEGVLVEPSAATNSFLQSEDLTDAAWSSIRALVSSNGDGSFTLTQNATDFAGGINQTVSFAGGEPATISWEVKAGTADWVFIRESGFVGLSRNTWFNVATGSVGILGSGHTASIEPRGDGWYRLSISGVNDGTARTAPVQLFVTQSDGSVTSSVDFNGSTILMRRPQFEQGSVPSSYIPTSGSTVTRAADTLTVPSANLPWSSDAVSIQMEGRVTYADTDSTTAEFNLVRWRSDADNFIAIETSTSAARTGEVFFSQEAAGVTDFIGSGATTYSPGINVPFNIASRHGSTFINGAVDGTALTADTTPTALPDLSTTDLKLAPNYMGTIRKLRIWADDLGDTGIEEASS